MSSKSDIRYAIMRETDVRRRIFLENYLVCCDQMAYHSDLCDAWFLPDVKLSWMKPDTVKEDIERTTRFLDNHNQCLDNFVSPHQATAYRHLTYWLDHKTDLWAFLKKACSKKLAGGNIIESTYDYSLIGVGMRGFCNVVSYVTKKAVYIPRPGQDCLLYAGFVVKPSADIIDFKLMPYEDVTVKIKAEKKPTFHDYIGKAKMSDYTYDVREGYKLPGNVDVGYYRQSHLETLYTIEMPDLEVTMYTFQKKKAFQLALLLKDLGAKVHTPFSNKETVIFLNDENL